MESADSQKIPKHPVKQLSYLRSGAAAGAASVLAFAAIHDLFISDIWFSVVFMMLAGALCGSLVAWSYSYLVENPSLGGWLIYNLLYVAIFGLLGAASVAFYSPVTTIAALVLANEPPDELFRQAMPLTALFTLISSVLVTFLYGPSWRRFGAVLLTTTVLILFLGLNVSAIGLVYIPRGSLYLIVELFALILAINVAYLAIFIFFERRSFLR